MENEGHSMETNGVKGINIPSLLIQKELTITFLLYFGVCNLFFFSEEEREKEPDS